MHFSHPYIGYHSLNTHDKNEVVTLCSFRILSLEEYTIYLPYWKINSVITTKNKPFREETVFRDLSLMVTLAGLPSYETSETSPIFEISFRPLEFLVQKCFLKIFRKFLNDFILSFSLCFFSR